LKASLTVMALNTDYQTLKPNNIMSNKKLTGEEPINPTYFDEGFQPKFTHCGEGLTKREYFAAMAMQGMMANPAIMEAVTVSEFIVGNASERIGSMSIKYADALITELTK